MVSTENVIEWDEDPLIFVFQDEIPGKHKMHVKRLDLKNWVRIDNTYPFQMEERKRLYKTNMADVFVSNHDTKTESCKWELFELLVEHVLQRFPQIFERKGSIIYNKVTKVSISTAADDEEDPLLRAGRLTQDDWIILEYDIDKQGYVLTAGILCFPMGWKLTEKFNHVMTDIHEPVKMYQIHLKNKVADLFVKMTPETPYWRSNWGIYTGLKSPYDLFIQSDTYGESTEIAESTEFPYKRHETGNELFLRCEYQTLRKLPKTRCIVFGIRTYQRYLHELRDLPVEVSVALRSSIENLEDEFLDYKGGKWWKKATVQYLNLIISDRNPAEKHTEWFPRIFMTSWFTRPLVLVGLAALTLIIGKAYLKR